MIKREVENDPKNKKFEFFFEIPEHNAFDFIFEYKGTLTKTYFIQNTVEIRKIPKHLKNTLFVDSKYKEHRNKDLEIKLMICNEIKQEGNFYYKKNYFHKAIDCYINVVL